MAKDPEFEASHYRFDLPGFNLPIDFVPHIPLSWPVGIQTLLFRNALCDDDRDSGLLECVVSVALI